MKTSKKILSVVLVLMVLANVFAVSAFAAFPDDTAVKLIITADKESYNPGDEITFTVSEQVVAEVGKMTIGGTYEIAYNSAGFEPYDASGTDLVANHGFVADAALASGFDNSSSQYIHNDTLLGMGNTIQVANSWDKFFSLSVAEAAVADRETIAADATASPLTLFTFKMKVPANAANGTYTIGFNKDGYDSYAAYSNDLVNMGLYGNGPDEAGAYGKSAMYECGTCTITVGAGGSTEPEQPTVKVNNLSTQVQWANKEAGLMNVGFRGQIAEGYDASADKAGTTGPNGGDNLAKLTEVGFYLNGTKYQAYTIYNFVDGGYFYRVVVGNVSYDSEATFSAQAYVMIDGQEYKADASFETTGKAQYERAITVGMEAK